MTNELYYVTPSDLSQTMKPRVCKILLHKTNLERNYGGGAGGGMHNVPPP